MKDRFYKIMLTIILVVIAVLVLDILQVREYLLDFGYVNSEFWVE